MKAGPFLQNDAELSEIIMEINDLRRVACAPDRPEQDRRRFCNRAFRRCPLTQDFNEQPP